MTSKGHGLSPASLGIIREQVPHNDHEVETETIYLIFRLGLRVFCFFFPTQSDLRVAENHKWQSWGHDAPPGPQLHHLSSPGPPTTEREPGGKEALHSSRRPEHRRQPRCKVGVVGCQRRKQRAPGWGRSTLPGRGQERRPQGPATSSKQREKERKVKTGRDHCRSPSKRHPWNSEPAPCSRCSREAKSSCLGLGCWPGKRSQTRGGGWGFCYHQTFQRQGSWGGGRSLLVVSVNLPLASLSWIGCSVHPELISLLHVPRKQGHLTTPKVWDPGILLLFSQDISLPMLSDTKRIWFLLSKHMPREYHSPC